MKTLFTLLAILCLAFTGYGQHLDYKQIKDSICPSTCGFRDSSDLREIYSRLQGLDPKQVARNLHNYYDDHAMIEYELYVLTSDTNYLRLSADNSVKAFETDPAKKLGLWNAAFCYSILNDCEKTNYYLTIYKDKATRKEMDRDQRYQIRTLETKCGIVLH